MTPSEWIAIFESSLAFSRRASDSEVSFAWESHECHVRADIVDGSIAIRAGNPHDLRSRGDFALIYTTLFAPAEAVRHVRGLLATAA